MRFPTYPTDILSRADAMLAAKYGTSEPIDPVLVEVACEAMMVERERVAAWHDQLAEAIELEIAGIKQSGGWVAHAYRDKGVDHRPIAKAIRGTE